jgi:ankyrin repeat protein
VHATQLPACLALVTHSTFTHTHTRFSGTTPLWLACGYGHADIVKLLIEQQSNVDTPNNTLDSPVLAASSRGHRDVVQALLNAKANVSAANKSGDTPLLTAVSSGHVTLLPLLLGAAGVDPQAKNRRGVSALGAAASQGSVEATRLLLGASADVTVCDENGARPLAIAAFCGSTAVTAELIAATQAKGADIDHRDSSGSTALWLAAASGWFFAHNRPYVQTCRGCAFPPGSMCCEQGVLCSPDALAL